MADPKIRDEERTRQAATRAILSARLQDANLGGRMSNPAPNPSPNPGGGFRVDVRLDASRVFDMRTAPHSVQMAAPWEIRGPVRMKGKVRVIRDR